MTNPTTRTRLLHATTLLLAPLLLLGARLTDITPQADTTADLLALIADRPSAWATGQWFFFLSGLAWVPAGVTLMRLFGRRARMGYWSAAAVAVGAAMVLAVDAAGVYLSSLATSSVPLDQQVRIVEGVESSPAILVFEIVHIVGFFGGLLLVAIALLRSRLVPVWSAALLLLGQVGLLAVSHPAADIVSMSCVVLGMGAAAHRVRNLSDDEWREGAAAGRRAPAREVVPMV